MLLRQQDAYTPQHLGEVLQGLFSQSEASGSEFFHLPGWDGLEPTPTCASGPGDFKSVFDPDSPGSHTRKFIGFGTSRGSGRRIHSFKIHRDMQGRPVICSREHDLFGPYSDGLLIFKDTEGNDGLHPGVESIPGVDLHPNEDHEFVMQKVEKLREILTRFGPREGDDQGGGLGDDQGPDLKAELVKVRRKGGEDCAKYWPAYDQKMRQLQPGSKARFSFEALPTTNQGDRCDAAAFAWVNALEDTDAAKNLALTYSLGDGKAVRGSAEAAVKALLEAVQSAEDTFELRQEFMELPGKELKMQGAAEADDRDATFDRAGTAVGDVCLIQVNPTDPGQEGKSWAVGVALDPVTKDHTKAHKKRTVPALFQDPEVDISVTLATLLPCLHLSVQSSSQKGYGLLALLHACLC